MAKKNGLFDRVRFVYSRSPILLKCAVLVTIVLSVAALTVLRIGIDTHKDRFDALRARAAQVEHENAEKEELIQQKDTVDGIKTIAQQELGMVEEDTEFFDVVANQN